MELASKKQDYQKMFWEFVGIAWRRKFWVIVPLVVGVMASVYLFFALPKVYQSNTLIMVEAQKVPQSIVQSAVTGSAQERLSSIKQQVLSRSFLMKIIDKFNLYQENTPSPFRKLMSRFGKENKPATSGEKIERMRKAILVQTKGRRQLESFSISFMGREPVTVMKVTNELASLVIEENLRIREGFIEGATNFLNGELDNLKQELERQENRFGAYKRKYLGELPEQLDSNLRALGRFQVSLDAIHLSRRGVNDRISDLEKAYQALSQQQGQVDTGIILESPIQGDALLPQSLLQELKLSREALSNLLTEYNDIYPDVVTLKRKVKDLEREVLKAQRRLTGSREGSLNELADGALNSADSGQAMVYVAQIRSESEELEDLKKREDEIRTQIRLYEIRVENTPKREQEMLVLRRDYNNIAKSYQSLLEKKLSAEISENLEKRQKGEKFRVIDPANLPEKPIKPNKMLVLLIGSVLGLGVGCGLAFIREQLDNSIRNAEEVERITSVLVLSVIPDFEDELRQMGKQKKHKVVDIDQFSGRNRHLRRGGGSQ